jgi:hypothetical protein
MPLQAIEVVVINRRDLAPRYDSSSAKRDSWACRVLNLSLPSSRTAECSRTS